MRKQSLILLLLLIICNMVGIYLFSSGHLVAGVVTTSSICTIAIIQILIIIERIVKKQVAKSALITSRDEYKGETKSRRISYLLTGYMHNQLTANQLDELDEWIGASDKNQQLFEELTDESRVTKALELLNE